jgi:hypothetical protein
MTDVSPEVLDKLAELIKATGAAGLPHGSAFLEYLKGFTEFFNAVAWPGTFLVGLFVFRPELVDFIKGIDKVKLPFGEISRKIRGELQQSAEEAGAAKGLSSAPTQGELLRAAEVERFAAKTDIATIRVQAEELASEYEHVRHTMLPGDTRTRKMEVVVSKMRTLARAFYPLRHDFANSASPGRRLMAIAALQIDPDYDMLDWLADRLAIEKPFVGYHAVVALLVAVKTEKAKAYLPAIESALEKAEQSRGALPAKSDRIQTLDAVQRELAKLK